MIKICDYNQHTLGKDRCRRHARFAVLQRIPYARAAGGTSEHTVYMPRFAFRCPDHVDGVPHEQRRITMQEYSALEAVANSITNEEGE